MLEIQRESAYADKLRPYIIILDGAVIGTIADGESKRFELASGEHTLHIKLDWAKSNKVKFEANGTTNIKFKCVSGLRGARLILAIVYATLLAHKYIKLERIS